MPLELNTLVYPISTGYRPCIGLNHPVIAAIELSYYMSAMTSLPANIPYLDPSGTNWATFSTCFCKTMQVMGKWGHFNGTKACPMPKKANAPMDTESEAIKS